ncbi:MAG: hypothetical protein HKN19_05575 [Halioglobus sp.]|nr:hypothetical protein [Halioglobus sp.]
MAIPFGRTLVLLALMALGLGFALSNARTETWSELLPFFEWMESTTFGVIGKTWGAAFALVQAAHLLSMAVLGGAVLAADGRLLGVVLRDQPLATVQEQAHRVFVWSLVVVVFTGVFMACGVAVKIYYLAVFWYKMLALFVGVLFAFAVRRPLLADDPDSLSPWLKRTVAIASIMVWFSVAATGRWIGFSG